MKIEVLYIDGCHAFQEAVRETAQALIDLGLKEDIVVKRVDTVDESKKLKFTGSPDIKINGEDVDPDFNKIKKFETIGCRPYFYKGKSYDFPPKEMIIEAIRKFGG